MDGMDPANREPHGWQEEGERRDFADSPGRLSEVLGRARAGEMDWEEIQHYAFRAMRAAAACSSIADALAAEVTRLRTDGKIPTESDVYF